jgi:DNA polymerase elongation subunit (family B)
MEVIALYSGVADETGIFVESATMNSHIVDTFAMRTIQKSNKKWIIPSTGNYDEGKGFRGAVVFPAKRGVHKFIFLFDFTSLYNRIIQSYYIDPIAYAHWKGTFTENGIDEFIEFSKLFGEMYGIEVNNNGKKARLPIFPALLLQMEQRRNELKEKRRQYKHGTAEYEMYEQLQKSAKVVLLAFYGVLGMSSSRWKVVKPIPEDKILRTDNDDEVDFRIPNEPFEVFVGIIPYLARTALIDTKEFFDRDKNIDVIYGDTDSIFVTPVELIDKSKTWNTLTPEEKIKLRDFGYEYSKKLEEFYKGRFETGIEMKLEKIFDRGIFGNVKKQYFCRTIWDEDLGWQEHWYEYVKGLPLVRTDREEFLKNMQRTTLEIILDDPTKLEETWTKTIKELFSNQRDHELIIRGGVKKLLSEYKNETPVIRAARMNAKNGITMRPGEKVAYLIVDVQDGKPIVEPIDEMVDPKEAIKWIPPVTEKALNWYWNKRIWKNIKPFLELVLDETTITKIELLKSKRVMLDSWFKQKI